MHCGFKKSLNDCPKKTYCAIIASMHKERYEPPVMQSDEPYMTNKIIDLNQYRKVKADYQKLLDQNPYTILTFEDYFKVREFLEKVHKAKLKKRLGKKEEEV